MEVVELQPDQRADFFMLARSVWPEFERRVGGRTLIDRLVASSK
jgi:hypothetical protein